MRVEVSVALSGADTVQITTETSGNVAPGGDVLKRPEKISTYL